ncbi:MAG TPA: trypsin-like peptidase domain-containing protein, partial [Solimonas sp.]|nr:trypsin-like peptidase domain-containing protein [Solimonas sp.]
LGTLQLPAGGELWFYSADGRDLQGPYSRSGRRLLPIVRDDEAVLEARMPLAAQDGFRIAVGEVFHGFRRLGGGDGVQAKGAMGDSESCNINTACADGNSWRNEIRSTVLYTRIERVILGATQVQCSGAMVNNTAQDDRPLVLSANHCGVGPSTNMSDVQVYFNVQKSSCSSTTDGPINQVVDGGTFLARDSGSDFSLFSLAARPPSSYNVYYAGWDARSDATPRSGVSIHHPGGDDKKISSYSSAARRVDNVQAGVGLTVDGWEVFWSRGVTEQGSSGSGLWNQDHRLVGTLSGGASSCSSPQSSDIYARFDAGWLANSTSTGQLKAHLDPRNSGALTLNGKNAGSAGTPVDPGSGTTGSTTGSSGGGGGGGALDLLALLAGLGLVAIRRRPLH